MAAASVRSGPEITMPLSLDPSTTALVLIDIQTGTLSFPLAPYDRSAVVAAAARLGDAFAAAKAPIVPVRIAFAGDGSDTPHGLVDQPMMLPQGGSADGWSDLAPEIQALPAAFSVTKRQWSAFYGTELDLQLRRRGIDTVVLCGIATNFGVETTARDAWQANYSVIVAEDACSSLGDLHAVAVERTLPRVSRVRSVDAIVAALG
ncbi:nicotinamidase-related amidase [Amorphus suaedae]